MEQNKLLYFHLIMTLSITLSMRRSSLILNFSHLLGYSPIYNFSRPKGFSSRLAQKRTTTSHRHLFLDTSGEAEDRENVPFTRIKLRDEAIEWCIFNNIPEPIESVHHLLAHALNLPYETGYRKIQQLSSSTMKESNNFVSDREYERFKNLLRRRMDHEPLQYLIGKWDFLDLTLKVQAPLLCPRPETEELVLLVEEEIREKLRSGIELQNILDVGCGTGAIGIALAYHLPNLKITAIDIEPIAIEVSNYNAQHILTNSSSKENNYKALLSSAADFVVPSTSLFDIIVSNPPYIPKGDMKTLEKTVINFEAWEALCGGFDQDDGLQVVNQILHQLTSWLKPGGSCWMEVDPSQPKKLNDQLSTSISKIKLESVHKDISGRDRFIKFIREK